ncbi:MAG TPA: Uma2 family endonuclease [Methylomirabilota bacterium]|nr:Uma2 family endonuclease [Methylomirabilota bacterium]
MRAMETGIKAKLDYDDYAGIPPDRNRYEIIDGELYVTPAPSPLHQRVSKRLFRVLEDYFEAPGRGEVFFAPIDLILTRHDVVQPDLVVVTDPAAISQRGIERPPALVVEVLSPSSASQDRHVKARRYATLGIPHYWIVDPEGRWIECFRADGDRYALVVRGEGDARLAHPDWPGLVVGLAAVWR